MEIRIPTNKQRAIDSLVVTQEVVDRFISKVEKTDTCWVWKASKGHKGYGQFCIGNVPVIASRAAYKIFNGELPADKAVCHTCDNSSCVNPSHLFLGTLEENNKDMWAKGRHYFQNDGTHMLDTKGIKNGNSKLTENQVAEIRNRTEPSHIVAKDYGISSSMVRHIKNGRNWRG